jgi:hypothetical protein
MVEFSSLPQTTRSLILATLGLEIASANCTSIFDLARKRNQSVSDVWRDVCRKTGQPRCTMPVRVVRPEYAAAEPFLEKSPTVASLGSAIALAPVHAASGVKPISTRTPATGVAPAAGVNPLSTRGSVTSAAPARSGHRGQNRSVMLAVGLGAILVVGMGIALMVATPRSLSTTTARPNETVVVKPKETARTGADRPSFDPNSVPVPEGTLRRMEGINKAFSKR